MPISPLIFKYNNETWRVMSLKSGCKLREGYAYIYSQFNPYVFPYRGEIDSLDEAVKVGVYYYEGQQFRCWPKTDDEKAIYNKDRIISLTTDSIFENLNNVAFDPILDREPIGDTDIFNPPIKETDDILLAGVKYAIGKKNISFSQYSHKFPDAATKNNGRRAIVCGTTMRPEMADRFGNVFDFNYALLFWDKPGAPHPMDPKYKKVFVISNGDDEIDFNDDSLEFETIKRE